MSTFTDALPAQDSAAGRGLKTAAQSIIGFVVGLVFVVWAVPGVPDAVWKYVSENFISLAILVGVPSGLTSFIWNYFRKDIPNY